MKTDLESLKEYLAFHGAPPMTEEQLLACVSLKKLLTTGDMPEEDWRRLYTNGLANNAVQGLSFENFKKKLRAQAPAYLYQVLNSGHQH